MTIRPGLLGRAERLVRVARDFWWVVPAAGSVLGALWGVVTRPLSDRIAAVDARASYRDSVKTEQLADVNNKFLIVVKALDSEPGSRERERAMGALSEGLIGPQPR